MVKIILDCRRTGRGAFTHCVGGEGVTVREFDTSRTGNHWSEEVTGESGAEIGIKDISNSGKHNCSVARLTAEGLETIKRNDGYSADCVVCDAV